MENTTRFQILTFLLLFPLLGQSPDWVWPDPPEDPKVRWVGSIADISGYRKDSGVKTWLARLLSGEQKPFFMQPMGLAVENGLIAVADPGKKGVFILNPESQKYRFIGPDDVEKKALFVPIDVTWTDDGLAVTSTAGPGIWEFRKDGTFRRYLVPQADIGRLTGIRYHDGHYYVVDTERHGVLVLDRDGRYLRTLGKHGAETGYLNYPTFLTVTPDGTIYVSDTMNFRVVSFRPDGSFRAAFGERGLAAGQLNRPKGVGVDIAGRVYTIDTSFDNFQIFNQNGSCLLVVSNSGHKTGELLSPTDLEIDGDMIYVTDTMNKRIQIFEMLYE